MDINPSKHSHFDGLHLGDTSTFTSAFPLDDEVSEIGSVLSSLQPLADSALAIHGASETFETNVEKGLIPLQPNKTLLAIERLEDKEVRQVVRSRQFVFRAITAGVELNTAQLEIDRDRQEIGALSLVCHGFDDGKPVSIELRAVINNELEDVYEIATYREDGQSTSYLIDAEVASDFIHALRENQAGSELPYLSKEDGLLELLDKSKHYSHYESGSYDIDGQSNLSLRIEREQKIVMGIAQTSLLMLELEETSFTGSLETIRQFGVTFDGDEVSARLNYLVRSLDGEMGSENRTSMFEEISIFLRDNPGVLLSALQQSLDQLAALD